MPINSLIERIHQELLPELKLESVDPHNPVIAHVVPEPWQLIGTGNYAAVVCHPSEPNWVVKVYAPGRPGWTEECEVYRRLGNHPSFSECAYSGEGFLVLKRLYGVTLYDCMHKGMLIPQRVIQDIDEALEFARSLGLNPHDVHGRNVMMADGRGVVADVSDFLHEEPCSAWEDLRRAYYWFYLPLFSRLRIRVPYVMLDGVRLVYRWFRRLCKRA